MNEHRSFDEFWPHYLAKHTHRGTRALHLMGTGLALVCIVALVWTGHPLWLLGLVGAYAFAWLGHGLVEKNMPATFSHPLWSLQADLKMFWLALTGRLGREFERAGIPQ